MSKRQDRRFTPLAGNPCTGSPYSTPARLVGVGFRLWLSGCRTGDVSCWENARLLYASQLSAPCADVVISELSSWVETVAQSAARKIEVLPDTCPGLCRDECLAVAMIAACQHKTCPAMRACAFALIENSNVEQVVDQSERFAMTLVAVDQVLSPNHIVNTAALAAQPASGYLQ